MTSTAGLPRSWDVETDVLVVGYGYAGAIAAIEATDSGAEALIIEKMPHPELPGPRLHPVR
jgi:succinate dehydrogenase/fumarate reductase flavoprotein subunit